MCSLKFCSQVHPVEPILNLLVHPELILNGFVGYGVLEF